MPAITLAIAMSAKYLRQVRATVLDELSKDYVAGAKARGVKFSVTLWKSIMKASLVTIITLLMLSVGNLLWEVKEAIEGCTRKFADERGDKMVSRIEV